MPTFIRLPSGRHINLDLVSWALPAEPHGPDGGAGLDLWSWGDPDGVTTLFGPDRDEVLRVLGGLAANVPVDIRIAEARAEAALYRERAEGLLRLATDAAIRLRGLADRCCGVAVSSDLEALAAELIAARPTAQG